MKNLSIFLLMWLCFSSCVAMFARKKMYITVRTTSGSGVIRYDTNYVGVKTGPSVYQLGQGDEVPVRHKKGVVLQVKRDRHKVLPITVTQDGREKTVLLRPRLSGLYYANLAHAYPLLAAGLLVDGWNPNRYGYPRLVYVDMHDITDSMYFTRKPLRRMVQPFTHKYWDIDVQPAMCNVNICLSGDDPSSAGLLGGNGSANWHYHPRRFLAVTGGLANFPGIYPGERFDRPGDTVQKNTRKDWFAGVQHVHALHHVELGYGLALWNFSGHSYYTIYPDHLQYDTKNYNHVALAANLSAYYFTNDVFSVGFHYRPQLVSLTSGSQGYAYALNIGVRFRIPTSVQRWHTDRN